MNIYEAIFGYISLILTMSIVAFIGYFATFQTDVFQRFYVKWYQRIYLNSRKKKFFLAKYYQAYAKWRYEYYKRQSRLKWVYYSSKFCGVFFLLFALALLIITIHNIFGVKLGLFTD